MLTISGSLKIQFFISKLSHYLNSRVLSTLVQALGINEDKTALNPRFVLCATEDKVGNIWLGTTLGPIYLYVSVLLVYLESHRA